MMTKKKNRIDMIMDEGRCPKCLGIWDHMLYRKVKGKDPNKVHECECESYY